LCANVCVDEKPFYRAEKRETTHWKARNKKGENDILPCYVTTKSKSWLIDRCIMIYAWQNPTTL
jgi:hypothetical protein